MERNFRFYERLLTAIDQSGKSANQIERELGYARNALHNYKNGSEPSGSRLLELANYFSLSPEYLIGKTEKKDLFDYPKQLFENLNENEKIEMSTYCQEWLFSQVKKYQN
jgi:transcriptional regulator with XRE-family HTH domain